MPINIFMAFTVRCDTLFDITNTGVVSRRNSDNTNPDWILKRNQQCNLDTIIQAISLRSQPENITIPEKKLINLKDGHNFGHIFNNNINVPYWTFTFEIYYNHVFHDGKDELGLLKQDCNKIPMTRCNTAWVELQNYLDTNYETKNTHFQTIRSY